MHKSGLAIALAGAMTLAACGSAGPSASVSKTTIPVDRKLVLASLDATTAARTARIDMQSQMSGGDEGSFTMRGDGIIDFDSGDSELRLSFDGAGALGLDEGFETRSVGGVVYMRMPSILAEVPGLSGDKPWIAIDLPQMGGGPGGGALFDMTGQNDPTKALAYLQKVSDDVREVGTDEIRGVDTTHYRATIDLSKSVDDADAPEGLRDAMKEFAGMLGKLPADVWIDGDGRMRRMRLAIDFEEVLGHLPAGTESDAAAGTMTQTLDFYDFGAAVHVEAPPSDQVVSLDERWFAGGGKRARAAA